MGFAINTAVGRTAITRRAVFLAGREGIAAAVQDSSIAVATTGWLLNFNDPSIRVSPSVAEVGQGPTASLFAAIQASGRVGTLRLHPAALPLDERWSASVSISAGHLLTEDTWMAANNANVAMCNDGKLVLLHATADLGFRLWVQDPHYPGWSSQPGDYIPPGEVSYLYPALLADLAGRRLILIAVQADRLVLQIRPARAGWSRPRTIWTPPSGMTLQGVPALWQEQLPIVIHGPGQATQGHGDFILGVGLRASGSSSDNSVQVLRLSWRDLETGNAVPEMPLILVPARFLVRGGVERVAAVSITQSPAISLLSHFVHRPWEVYCSYDPITLMYTQSGATWSPPTVIWTAF